MTNIPDTVSRKALFDWLDGWGKSDSALLNISYIRKIIENFPYTESEGEAAKLREAMEQIRIIATDSNLLPQQALNKIHGLASQIVLGIDTSETAVQPIWEPIHNNFFQDLRCLVSDGDKVAMGWYSDGQWYADDLSPVVIEEITHFMIIHPPGIKDGREEE